MRFHILLNDVNRFVFTITGRLKENGHWQWFTRFNDTESAVFPQASATLYMLVDKKLSEIPKAAIVAKVTGTNDIPDVMNKFMPTKFGTYQFTDMELLKDWKSTFSIIASMEDLTLIPDPTFENEWKKGDMKVFTDEEEKILISGMHRLIF